jgi:hypothetical protein
MSFVGTAMNVNCCDRANPFVILTVGPRHLFWTTGVYYLWELSKNYRVVLIATDDYKNDDLFIKVFRQTGVVEILYTPLKVLLTPLNLGIFKKHYFYARKFKKLVEKYLPALVLQYRHVYPDNLYLAHWTRKLNPSCPLITYQLGLGSLSEDYDYRIGFISAVRDRSKKYRLSIWLTRILLHIKIELDHLMEHYILPFLFTGSIFFPSYKKRTGKVITKSAGRNFDLYLLCKERERLLEEKRIGVLNKLFLIRHPLETVGEECNSFLFHAEEEKMISIFPTSGFTSVFVVEQERSETEVVEHITTKWLNAINVFREKFSGWRITWKLHPATRSDRIWQEITIRLRQNCPRLEVVEPEQQALPLMVRSKIIVSDVSTVLWWASFLKDKAAISLDVFGYPGAEDIKDCEGIFYFDSFDKLRKACDSNLFINARKSSVAADADTLTSFLAKTITKQTKDIESFHGAVCCVEEASVA